MACASSTRRVLVQSDLQHLDRAVERQVDRDVAHHPRLALEIDVLVDLTRSGVLVRHGGAPVRVADVEVHAALSEGVHVAHARRVRPFEAKGHRRGVGAEADSPARRVHARGSRPPWETYRASAPAGARTRRGFPETRAGRRHRFSGSSPASNAVRCPGRRAIRRPRTGRN